MYKVYSVGTKERSDFYELWQQQKQLKTMDMNEAWPDIYDERYTSLPTWAHPQNPVLAAETPSLKISSHGISLEWSWRLPVSIRIEKECEEILTQGKSHSWLWIWQGTKYSMVTQGSEQNAPF